MANNETFKKELEVELKRIELEISELELEIYKNNIESVKAKEKIDEDKNLPESEIEVFIENAITGIKPNNDVLSDNLMKIGALNYKNYCLENEKFSLESLKDELNKQLGRPKLD